MSQSAIVPPHQAEPVLTQLTDDLVDGYRAAEDRGFHEETPVEHLPLLRKVLDPARFFGLTVADDRWIATCGSYERQLSVPGGVSLPVAAVTAVTVRSGYRRRGMMRKMMVSELHRAGERGEKIAALYASESGIYGRFGFGRASTEASLSGPTDGLRLHRDVTAKLSDAGGSVDEVPREQFVPVAAPLYETVRASRPGLLSRTPIWWDIVLSDPPAWRAGATPLRYVVSFAADGQPDGYAVYRVKNNYDSGNPDGEVQVREIMATDALGFARLWRYIGELDLVRTFSMLRAPTDHLLGHLAADPRAIRTRTLDQLYVRLIDVAGALAARSYATEIDLVIEVTDPVLVEQSGRYRLRGSHNGADVSQSQAAPDLTMGARELGAVYLGGISLGVLHAAGLVTEHHPGSVVAASAAFRSPVEPFCSEMF